MSHADLPQIQQVLLVRHEETLEQFGPALWTMFEEVEKLYNLKGPLADFSRLCLTHHIPPDLEQRIEEKDLLKLSDHQWSALWSGCQGAYAETIDQDRLAQQLALALAMTDRPLVNAVILTDQEMTPPPEWRYILFGAAHGGSAVVSLGPMDPEYWGIYDDDRLGTVKHRARAACMCVTGTALGLHRCENEQCYMFGSVDSVVRLDVM